MKFSKKTKISSEIPTASMPDIIFMLLVFFMVTTVLKEYSGLPVNLPKAKRIEKLKSKRNTVQVWLSKDGLISIDDRLMAADDVSTVMYDKRLANPQIVVSLKGDEEAEMGLVSKIHENLREVEALKLNFYISVSGIITFKNAENIRQVIKKVPLERLLVETDAPYLAPIPERGKRNEPSFVESVAKSIANLRSSDLSKVAEESSRNAEDLFKFDLIN